jgi:carotenoid 1,2-hydratase
MPTLSLYETSAHPDAWHQVTAPGGYEWWYFDAEDSASDTRMVAIFFQGFVFHPGYLRRFGKYHRSPTRNAPPLPAEFPCVYFVVYRGGKISAQFMCQFPADAFAASTRAPEVSIGPNRLLPAGDGSLELQLSGVPWQLTGRGPKFLESQLLTGSFRFTPRFSHEPMQRRFFSRSWSGADHHWVIANPLCAVRGDAKLTDAITGQSTTFTINGPGYHDHNYGSGPIGPGLSRWMWGRVLLEDHAMMFHLAQPRNRQFPDELHLLESQPLGTREIAVDRFTAGWTGRSATLLRYPIWLEAGPLRLTNPRIVDDSPFYLRLAYEASIRGQPGQAFCEIAYPHRLRWPVLGRMIEMSILVQSLDTVQKLT